MTHGERTAKIPAIRHSVGDRIVRRGPANFGKALVAVVALAAPAAVAAHNFALGVVVGEDAAAAQMEAAIRGMLLATRERDGHAGETSDGHLGGIDVFIVPLPVDAAGTIAGLKRVPQTSIDIAILIGPDAATDPETARLDPQTVTIRPGTFDTNPPEARAAFAARFQDAYGTAPDRWALEGYNAARRIDLAVRRQGGVDDRAALIAALAATAEGIEW